MPLNVTDIHLEKNTRKSAHLNTDCNRLSHKNEQNLLCQVQIKNQRNAHTLTGTTSINGRPMLKALCDVCGSKKSTFTSDRSTGGKLDIHALIGKLLRPKSGWTPWGIHTWVPTIR